MLFASIAFVEICFIQAWAHYTCVSSVIMRIADPTAQIYKDCI